MPSCIYCRKTDHSAKKVTFHRFPRDEKSWKQWTEILGLKELVPKKNCFLCSDHFPEDSFARFDSRVKKKLISGKLPAITAKTFNCESPVSRDKLVEPNDPHSGFPDIPQDTFIPCMTENVPEPSGIEIECTSCSPNADEKSDLYKYNSALFFDGFERK